MIVSKVAYAQDDAPRYVITQGMIDWSNENWYQDTANTLWLQLVMTGVKDWLYCRRELKPAKENAGFQFINTLSGLVKTIDAGLHSEMKMAAEKVINLKLSRKNKTSIGISARILFDIVDSVTVNCEFFDNPDQGSYINVSMRESETRHYEHLMLLRKINMPEKVAAQLAGYRSFADMSDLIGRNYLEQVRQKTSLS